MKIPGKAAVQARNNFQMIEPLPSTTPYAQRRPICKQPPRILSLDDALPGTAPELHMDDTFRFNQRLDALKQVVAAPNRAIHKMARWLARRRLGARRRPFKLGKPPGADRAFLENPLGDPLYELHHLAMEALDDIVLYDTS